MANKGDWVQLKSTILEPSQRAPQVPADTAKVPLQQWVKGHLLADAEPGQTARVTTLTGRVVEGILTEVNPCYHHGFGAFVPELLAVQRGIRDALFGEDSHD